MKRRVLTALIIVMFLMASLSAQGTNKLTDNADLSENIAACGQFGDYEKIAEALLCAASIPYGETPEQCVKELQDKGFEFEYEIATDLPFDTVSFDITYSADGTAELPMMRVVTLHFSPNVTLYMRTETHMISLKPANDMVGTIDGDFWTPDEESSDGRIVAAHLQFFDEIAQEWITWTFTSPDDFKNA